MRHVASRALTILSLAGVAWLAVLLVGKSSALTAERQTIAAMKEENGVIVEAAWRRARTDSAKYADALAAAKREARQARARLDGQLVSTTYTLDSARAFLNAERGDVTVVVAGDTLYRSAFVNELLSTLSQTTQQGFALTAEVSRYETAVDSVEAAHQRERAALYGILTLADSTIRVKNEAMNAWKKAAECRVIGFKCPTRTQTFVLGAVVTVAATVYFNR